MLNETLKYFKYPNVLPEYINHPVKLLVLTQ